MRKVDPLLVLVVLTAACGSNPTAPSQPVTESLGGSLATGNANYHTFTTKGSGDLSLTLNSIDPTASVTVGVGLGTVSNGACTLQFVNEGFIVGAVWSNTITGAAALRTPVALATENSVPAGIRCMWTEG